MQIVVASRNKGKIREIETLLSEITSDNIEILSLNDIGVTGEIEETGTTFEENAKIKARTGAAKGYITIADDSGLCVDALNGEPGVFSARWSGGDDEANNDLLLEKLKDVPFEKRTAHYVSCVVCLFPDGREIVTQGKCDGIIGFERKGKNGFGYDPLFYFPEFDKTFAEIPAETKHKVSHRGKAMASFKKEFAALLNK